MHKKIRRMTAVMTKILMGLLIFGLIVMLLWNALMPDIFHLQVINYWQALGLLILSKLLLTGFFGNSGGNWRKRAMKDKWADMTPEERDRFRQEWSHRCRRPFPPDSQSHEAAGGEQPA